ncbi:MAG: nucleotidyltransferase [Planctomycetota bacterium]|nr:MAG: nucleotidyltransferase [Planctomycetota bacterium]REK24550.1 MAG: nucleotidyltransferase [Planctomycetota bacterium]REK34651.1 MAG: nucleotidyltransferase [Planctomycetota bacterium]
MSRDDLQDRYRRSILEIASRYGASNVRIFGSVARGEEDSQSDVDFLVDLAPDRSLLDLGGLLIELRELLSCRVDVATEAGLKPAVRQTVLREATPL